MATDLRLAAAGLIRTGQVQGAAEKGPDSQGEVTSEEVEAYFQATQDRSPPPGNNFQVRSGGSVPVPTHSQPT